MMKRIYSRRRYMEREGKFRKCKRDSRGV